MYHGAMPSFLIGGQMIDNTMEQWTTEAFVAINGTQFGPFFLWLMLNLIPFRRDALIEDLFSGSSSKISSKRHRNPSGQQLTKHNQQQPPKSTFAHRHDKHKGSNQAVVKSKYDLAQPISIM